ncbi:carbon-nitrogen hydrolase family protein [Sulfurovum sp. TSL1]|uniref:carbon-nitrogen hydrolase family protein n=1 Tax=Sulfurovum sp. TSL1 TaxID=2826994 RepID=UPI001CC5F9B8|nr:carbon-nitrogen hydrolase family protein [Sulfurovum sp. TSL1]GIT98858.1 carbon-nitrogen hydrolase family protein [Sulfurovum sp. TSL1]
MLILPKTMEVVTLQLPSHKRYQENLDTLLFHLREHQDKHIVVAPEVFMTSFDYEHMATAAKFSANALKTLKKEVNDQIVVFTLILEEDGHFVNQAVVIHKHKIVHRQEKVKLFKLGDEDLYFLEGKKKKIKPFEIEGVKYAILICFELRFKELWQQLEGADVVFVPSRWGKPRKTHLEVLSRALAVMNQCYVVVSNSCDEDMASASSIISPTGEVTKDDTLEAVEGCIDFREIKKMRRYIVMD